MRTPLARLGYSQVTLEIRQTAGRNFIMHRFFNWLSKRINPERKSSDAHLWQSNLRPALKRTRRKQPSVDPLEYHAELGGRIADGGPGKNVLIRSKYVREDTGTHETLKIISASAPGQEDDCGQDPYNSGRFDRSKSWGSTRLRK